MNDSQMEIDDEPQLYVRTLEDSNSIIRHAKLDSRTLTPITQALYYPSAEDAESGLKMMELDDHLLEMIRAGKNLYIKGGLNEKAVICTDERTYEMKVAEISNSLLLVPELKFAAETTTSPLKSPRIGNTSKDQSLNSSSENDEDNRERILEHRKIRGIFHEYFECREIRPRFRKIGEWLQKTRYSGPENEELIDRTELVTFTELLESVQCSEKQFADGLNMYRVIEYDGHMRVLDYEYEYRIVNLMVGLISENSWPLDEIEHDETIAALDGIAPNEIVEGLFKTYTFPTEKVGKEGKFTYKEELVARIIAQNILQPGLKFRVDDFMSTWLEALPEGMNCKNEYLRGLGVFDKENTTACIRALPEEDLPMNLHERMKLLFKTKRRWTLDEMEPYIECFSTPSLSVSTILTKYARSLTEQDVRYYVSKH